MEKTEQTREAPLVSVVIPCYNHAHYLPEAIESVLRQGYPGTEILVVDDGSSDDTPQVARRYPGVRYVHQPNSGLSAARNTGIRHSAGEYLVFLDADDWLTPGSIQRNLQHLIQDPKLAFVSGAHEKHFVDEKRVKTEKREVTSNHYWHLLQSNYIGVPAAAMFRRWVFNELLYDITPPNSCADYDMFLNAARRYPVCHHTDVVAAYRIHPTSMSANIPGMLQTVLKVLRLQEKYLTSETERKALRNGEANWKEYYCQELYKKVKTGQLAASEAILNTLRKYGPKYYLKYVLTKQYSLVKAALK